MKATMVLLPRLFVAMMWCAATIWSSVLSGCSIIAGDSVAAAAHDAVYSQDLSRIGYTLLLQRSSLTSRDFESYKTVPTGVFIECGVILRGRPEVRFQRIESPDSAALEETKRLAQEIIISYRDVDPRSIDPEGSSAGFTDPGSFILSASDGDAKMHLATSVDWVERRRGALATLVNRFAQAVRRLPSKPPCGSVEFYGIGRLK